MLFISWSGSPSKEIGSVLKNWLEVVFDGLPIFFSEETQPGKRWSLELAQGLESCQVGIFIYTRLNLDSLWMAFEAGALSKRIKTGQVMPIIFGANAMELTGPLAQFQARRFTKEGMFHVLSVINDVCLESAKTEAQLRKKIEYTWERIEKDVETHLNAYDGKENKKPNVSETLENIFSLIESSNLANPEFSEDIAELVRQVKSSHEDTKALLAKIKTTLRGSYLFIDGTRPAFSALTAATMRAKKCIRSTRFSPMSISGNHDDYGQAINEMVAGKDAIEHYMRIIAANHPSKLTDIYEYLRQFRGRNFDLFLTKKTGVVAPILKQHCYPRQPSPRGPFFD